MDGKVVLFDILWSGLFGCCVCVGAMGHMGCEVHETMIYNGDESFSDVYSRKDGCAI